MCPWPVGSMSSGPVEGPGGGGTPGRKRQSRPPQEDKGGTPSPRTPCGVATNGACCAKQSQSGGRSEAEGRRALRGATVRNKANGRRVPSSRCKVPGGAIVRNKANSQGAMMSDNSCSGKGLCEKGSDCGSAKTKPIRRGRPETAGWRPEETARRLCETKPIRRRQLAAWSGDRAKQSQ